MRSFSTHSATINALLTSAVCEDMFAPLNGCKPEHAERIAEIARQVNGVKDRPDGSASIIV